MMRVAGPFIYSRRIRPNLNSVLFNNTSGKALPYFFFPEKVQLISEPLVLLERECAKDE